MFSITEKATQKRAKLHNKRLVLKTIYDQGPISRADIARTTHLARTTVSSVVARLIEEGLVAVVGQRSLDRGKPAVLLSTVDNVRRIVGVDLGGREIQGVIADLRGAVIRRIQSPLAGLEGEAALEQLYHLIDALIAKDRESILGIGLGVPGVVDVRQGVVRQSGRLDWWDLPLKKCLEDRYNLPVHIANDSHVAAFGEYTFGNGQDVSNLVLITVGMGVSAGIVLDGRLHFGDSFGAGEIGHLTVVRGENAIRCACGNKGCLETVVNEQTLVEQAREIARRNPHSPLHHFAPSPEAIDLDAVIKAFRTGDEDLQRVIMLMGRRLGDAIAAIASILNIQRIVISGSLADLGPTFVEAMQTELTASLHPMLAAQTNIQLSRLERDIVLKGAIAVVLSAETGLV